MTTFVLVHGGWSGAHTWHLLRPLLRQAGHHVFTPSLTGLGERVHLADEEVDLSTHITDVVNHLFYEDLHEIVLVGHSYGGMVVTGVADREADRIEHLVYLDAFVPHDGQSLYDLTGGYGTGIGGTEPFIQPVPRQLSDKTEEAWINERRVAQPRQCFTEKLRLSRPLEDHPFTLAYIKATADAQENTAPQRSAFWRIADQVRSDSRWQYHEIATSHMAQNEKPLELTNLLLNIIR